MSPRKSPGKAQHIAAALRLAPLSTHLEGEGRLLCCHTVSQQKGIFAFKLWNTSPLK